jgi:VWFA-related protein
MIKVLLMIAAIAVACLPVFSQTSKRTSTSSAKAPALKNNDAGTRQRRPVVQQRNAPSQKAGTEIGPPPPLNLNPTKEDDVITVETNLVTTPVSVLDRQGRFIAGLKKKDFTLTENGMPQKITYFQSEEQPFTVVLMIDTSPSTKYRIDEIHYAAVTFVNQLRPSDKVVVMAFDQRLKVLCEPTSEKPRLYAAIYSAKFGSGTSLYDAVDHVVNLDMVQAAGRKAVVLFTDGVDTTSRRSDYASTLAGVEEVDALFYPIRYNTQTANDPMRSVIAALPPGYPIPPNIVARVGRGQSTAEYEKGRNYLESLASYSGGRMFEADTVQNIEAAFAGVAEELRRQYSIGYYPDDTGKPGDRRQIKIKVARPNTVVRSKTTYVIKEPAGEQAAATGR